MRFLLIGAEPSFSDWMSRSLSSQGIALDVAHLTQIQQPGISTFAAVIVDLEPHRSRQTVSIKRLRQLYRNMPILALTGSDADARVRSLRSGADDCLAKPIVIAELIERLRLLSRHAHLPADRAIRVKGLALDSANCEI